MALNILFDLDGTLTDPAEGITNGIKYMLEKKGLPVPPTEELYQFIGPPLVPSFMSVFGMTEEEAKDGVRLYREYYAPTGLFENHPYEGIGEALGKLRDLGFVIGLATSKPEEFAYKILERFGLIGYFDKVSGASLTENRTEKAQVIAYALERMGAEAKDTIMVGDRKHDVLGAKEFGIPTVGVLWGYGSDEELKEAGAVRTVSTMDEMVAVLKDKRDAKLIETMVKAGVEASRAISGIYRSEYKVEIKEDDSPVTSADLASEKIIIPTLMAEFPIMSVLSEESCDSDSEERLHNRHGVFIIDPLDGTVEFVNRTGEFSVSIGYSLDHRAYAGVIAVPELGLVYYACEGHGAYKLTFDEYTEDFTLGCGTIIHVSDRTDNLRVTVSRTYKTPETDGLLERHKSRISEVLTVGSCLKGCRIAEGLAEVHYRYGDKTKEWDTAAMQCIVEEAGGLFINYDGTVPKLNRKDYYNRGGFIILNRAEARLE